MSHWLQISADLKWFLSWSAKHIALNSMNGVGIQSRNRSKLGKNRHERPFEKSKQGICITP